MSITKVTSKSVEADAKYIVDVDTVDGIHAESSATANRLLALDGSSQLPASADMVDGKHWNHFKGGSVTFILGNKDRVLETDEKAMACFQFACTITEVHIREMDEISGSVDLDCYRADGDDDSTWALLEDISMVSQWYRAETGKTWAITIGDWVKIQTNGAATSLKEIAVTLFFERT